MTQIRDVAGLDRYLEVWGAAEQTEKLPIGYILSLEGADSILSLKHLERAYEEGLRAIGPAHYGPDVYATGTGASGGFNSKGRKLLQEMKWQGCIFAVSDQLDECV